MTIEFFAESNVGTRKLPRALATKAGGFLFVGGQIARDENGNLIAGGIEAQTRQTMKNVAQALALAGCALEGHCGAVKYEANIDQGESLIRVYGER